MGVAYPFQGSSAETVTEAVPRKRLDEDGTSARHRTNGNGDDEPIIPFVDGHVWGELPSGPLVIREHGQNRLTGTIAVARPRILFFSIPFDRGWKARVDGSTATLLPLNVGFMGLILEPGRHTIELEFQPPFLVAGTGISLGTFLLYGGLLLRGRRGKHSEARS